MMAQRIPASRPPATKAQAAALASSVRLRIIRLTYEHALTNKQIAQRLDKDPATALYHVRKLVAAGFLTAQPIRVGARGAKEIPYRSTGLSWRLASVVDERAVAGQAMLEAFLDEVAEVGTDALEQTRLVMRLNASGRAELMNRLGSLLDEFAARPKAADGELVAVYLATYPGE